MARIPRPASEKHAVFAPLVEAAVQHWQAHPDSLREMQQAIIGRSTVLAETQETVSPAPSPEPKIALAEQEQYRKILTSKREWADRIVAMVRQIESDDADRVRDLLADHKQALSAMSRQIQLGSSPTALAQTEADLVGIEGIVRRLIAVIAAG